MNSNQDISEFSFSPNDEYFLSDWFELDEDHLRAFSYSTYMDPRHVDLSVSYNNPYGSDLVDGFWMVSILMYFHFKYGRKGKPGEYGFNYGLDKVRFLSPLILGERIRVRSTINRIREHSLGVLITTHNVMEVEAKTTPAMVADLHLLRITK